MKAINLQTSLIEQCQQGSRKAQFQLYHQYSKAMYNTCYRMLGSMEEAEDLLQKSFLDVFKKYTSIGRKQRLVHGSSAL